MNVKVRHWTCLEAGNNAALETLTGRIIIRTGLRFPETSVLSDALRGTSVSEHGLNPNDGCTLLYHTPCDNAHWFIINRTFI